MFQLLQATKYTLLFHCLGKLAEIRHVLSRFFVIYCRGVTRGGPEPPRNLADQLTLYEVGWSDFAPHTTASPPGFKKLSAPCVMYENYQTMYLIFQTFSNPSLPFAQVHIY